MTLRLAMAAAMAAGMAVMVPVAAQAYDNIAPIGSVAAANTIIDGPAAVPYGGYYGPGFGDYRSERGYYGKTTRVHHGPFHDHAEVVVPRRLGRGGEARTHVVNYYYPAPAFYARNWPAGW